MARKAERHLQVYDYLKSFKCTEDGLIPTYEEIAAHFGWASKNTAWYHVNRLAEEQLITFDSKRRIRIGGKWCPPTPPGQSPVACT